MATRSESREFETTGDTDIIDLTGVAHEFVRSGVIQEGLLVVFTPGSTAGITTLEYESGAIADLKRALEGMAPRHGEYEHNLRWGDGNGYSHVRSALIGPSLVVPVRDGRLELGAWQQIILCDFDNRPRRRRVTLQLVGA